mmetsp:Transcript_24453/g.36224  ORF Transcript_24453/g.36224 Transcript_24453/m.36224 type:complete len:381 (-) Transcript_24453:453-1595(-)
MHRPSISSLLLSTLLLTPFQFASMISITLADEVLPAAVENNEAAEAAVTIDNHKVNAHVNVNANANANGNTISSEAGDLFQILDRNHDHKLTLSDFNYMDTDNNEQISLDEFKNAISNGDGNGNTKKNFFSSSNSGNNNNNNDDNGTGGFAKGFTSSTAMILATEIGDKTFFIAAVLSMRHARLTVFAGAILALTCMTILSTMMGLVLPSLLPRQYTHIIGGLLFLYFGVKLIYDSRSMSDKVSDELEEVEEELGCHSKKNDEDRKDDPENPDSQNGNGSSNGNGNSSDSKKVKNIFFQAFLLTFLAEWGDRSQIATIALAAAKDPFGVTAGAVFGHSMCTGMAVMGGRMLASRISEKTVTYWGGVIFLLFGVHAFIFDV